MGVEVWVTAILSCQERTACHITRNDTSELRKVARRWTDTLGTYLVLFKTWNNNTAMKHSHETHEKKESSNPVLSILNKVLRLVLCTSPSILCFYTNVLDQTSVSSAHE